MWVGGGAGYHVAREYNLSGCVYVVNKALRRKMMIKGVHLTMPDGSFGKRI